MMTTEERRDALDEQRKQLEMQYQRILGAIDVCNEMLQGEEGLVTAIPTPVKENPTNDTKKKVDKK